MKSKWVLVSLSLFVIMYVANLAHASHVAEMMLRWLAVAALLFYGWQKKTNTTWIMVFMVVGACFGHDFPRIAANGRVPSMIFIRLVKTTSEPALPVALQNMERLGCSQQACALVLPLGYSFNLDGSTLYLSLGTVFVAQVAGVHLHFQPR
jgi:Na+/H+-dicarboxylate symporter